MASKWTKEKVAQLIEVYKYRSLKDWREIDSGSYQWAARNRVVSELAVRYNLEYNPTKARYHEDKFISK